MHSLFCPQRVTLSHTRPAFLFGGCVYLRHLKPGNKIVAGSLKRIWKVRAPGDLRTSPQQQLVAEGFFEGPWESHKCLLSKGSGN